MEGLVLGELGVGWRERGALAKRVWAGQGLQLPEVWGPGWLGWLGGSLGVVPRFEPRLEGILLRERGAGRGW